MKPTAFWMVLSALILTMGIKPVPGTPPSSCKPIRIGFSSSFEGRYAEPAWMARKAYQLWAKQVNESGGLLGRPVKLIVYDDRSREDVAQSLYRKLILEDKVDLVLSPYSTPLTYAVSEVTEPHGFLLLASGASGEKIWSRRYRYVFGVYAPARRYFIGFMDIIAQHGIDTVAIIHGPKAFSTAAAAGALQWAQRFGVKVTYVATFKDPAQDFPSLLRRCKGQASALVLCGYPQDDYVFLRQLAQTGWHPKALGITIAPALPDFAQKAGAEAEGVFGPSQWEPDTRIPFPGTRKFIRDFVSFTGRTPSYHAGAAFAACQVLARAIRFTQSLDQRKLRDSIAALDTVTVIGRFKVDETGKQIGHSPLLIQWQKGKKEIVYPHTLQTAEPLFRHEPVR